MTPFLIHSGIAVSLLQDNIDTDQIIPSREMKTVSKTGLAAGLFAGQRYIEGRKANPDFVLNQAQFKDATILMSGKNFGCGSSREHAVWALKDYGFRAVIAQSFGEIFYNNCVRNGILPVQMEEAIMARLTDKLIIDLPNQRVNEAAFNIAQSDKKMLMEGLDMIAQTSNHKADIDAFFKKDKTDRPWAYRWL